MLGDYYNIAVWIDSLIQVLAIKQYFNHKQCDKTLQKHLKWRNI